MNYSSVSSKPSERAKALLIHYFQTLFEAQGLRWDEDNESEISDLIDAILEAAE